MDSSSEGRREKKELARKFKDTQHSTNGNGRVEPFSSPRGPRPTSGRPGLLLGLLLLWLTAHTPFLVYV